VNWPTKASCCWIDFKGFLALLNRFDQFSSYGAPGMHMISVIELFPAGFKFFLPLAEQSFFFFELLFKQVNPFLIF